MPHTRSEFVGLAYGVPFGVFGLIFVLLTIINKRVNWLLLRSILGIGFHVEDDAQSEKKSTQSQKPDDLNNYLYIDFEEEDKENSAKLSCIQRFLSDVLASAILGIFFTIIYNGLILSTETVADSGKCPDFDAYCYGGSRSQSIGPFNCTKGGTTSFSLPSKTWWCVGWVYKDKTVKEVLDTLGVCGGLLGLVSSVVPLVYYLSYYKKCACPFSVTWIVPLIPPAALGVVVWYTQPVGPSILAIVTLSVFITMVFLGWSWAARRSCKWRSCVEMFCCCCSKISIRKDRCFCLTQKSKSYPWCCCTCGNAPNAHGCYKFCRRNPCCWNKWLDFCCENEVEFGQNNQEPTPSPVHIIIQVQPQPSKEQSRPPTSRSQKIV